MKVITTVILSLTLAIGVFSFPSGKHLDEEVEIVPLEGQFGREPIVDTGVIGGPFSSPFDGFFESFSDVMTRLRQQVNRLLSGREGNSTSEGFPGLPFPNIPELDLSKGNTTSVTKIIDGHKVVINETEYKQGDGFGDTFIKVRIIDVKPDSDETTERDTEEITSGSTKDTEPLENSQENEISKAKHPETTTMEVSSGMETMDENDGPTFTSQKFPSKVSAEWNDLAGLESFEDNEIDADFNSSNNLNNDIYVNTLLANSGAPTNPDAEVFSHSEMNFPQTSGSSTGPKFEKLINPR